MGIKKWGIILLRGQPFHNGHLHLIKEAHDNNDAVLIVLGSADKVSDVRNPFNISLRCELLYKSLIENSDIIDMDKIIIKPFNDWTQENDVTEECGRFLYYNISHIINQKNFSIYYSDNPEIMQSWFEPYILDRISFKFFDRSKICDGLSATKIRDALLNDDIKYIKKYYPNAIVKEFDKLRNILYNIKEEF